MGIMEEAYKPVISDVCSKSISGIFNNAEGLENCITELIGLEPNCNELRPIINKLQSIQFGIECHLSMMKADILQGCDSTKIEELQTGINHYLNSK